MTTGYSSYDGEAAIVKMTTGEIAGTVRAISFSGNIKSAALSYTGRGWFVNISGKI